MDLNARLAESKPLIERTALLCAASESLCAESEAIRQSTKEAIADAWRAVDRQRRLVAAALPAALEHTPDV